MIQINLALKHVTVRIAASILLKIQRSIKCAMSQIFSVCRERHIAFSDRSNLTEGCFHIIVSSLKILHFGSEACCALCYFF